MWVEESKGRAPEQERALHKLQELAIYMTKRRIRVKEMFQPYMPYGPGSRIDSEQLLIALHRFRLAEDWTLSDTVEMMLAVDPYCNGTVLLTELARIITRVEKLEEPDDLPTSETISKPSTRAASNGRMVSVSPLHKFHPSSFSSFVNQLDSTVGQTPNLKNTVQSSAYESAAATN